MSEQYRPRPRIQPEEFKKSVLQLVDNLIELRAQTDPAGGAGTAKDKDYAALEALRIMNHLTSGLVGWAIDHQTGLALAGLDFLPRPVGNMRQMPEYAEAKEDVDDHRHEVAGREYHGRSLVYGRSSDTGDPLADRRILRRLIESNHGAFPAGLALRAAIALKALDYGEVRPIFDRSREGHKADLTERELMLRALELMAYRRAQGSKKERAATDVSDAYNVSLSTLLKWEQRLREEFGQLVMARRVTFARNAASYAEAVRKAAIRGEPSSDELDQYTEIARMSEDEFGDAALVEYGKRYREAQRLRGSRNRRDKR